MPRADDPRARILNAAADLLRRHGAAAVTTRAVGEAAGVQAPALYRSFGDKDGLLVAAAEHVLAVWVAEKQAVVRAASDGDVDPLEDLRRGWDSQIAFSVAHPSVFRLLSDPVLAPRSLSLQAGRRVLEARVHRLARAGRLRVSEPAAVDLVLAIGAGVVQALLVVTPKRRDPDLSARAYEAVLHMILSDRPSAPEDRTVTAAVALRADVEEQQALTAAERALLGEWLDRVVASEQRHQLRSRQVQRDPHRQQPQHALQRPEHPPARPQTPDPPPRPPPHSAASPPTPTPDSPPADRTPAGHAKRSTSGLIGF